MRLSFLQLAVKYQTTCISCNSHHIAVMSVYRFSSNPFQRFSNTFQHFKSSTFGGFNMGNMGSFGGHNPLTYFLEHCQESHARDIASRMGVSVQNIQFTTVSDASNKTKIKAYIDAPNASNEQIKQLAESVAKECPMAKFNHMMGNDDVEWIKR
eukprot:295963_1